MRPPSAGPIFEGQLPAAGVEDSKFTIDGLARAGDTTVRSIRVYHERGVLPPPEIRGRIGYYGPEHLNRLRTISRLLSRGVKINGIKELLEAWDRGEGLAEVLGVADEPGEDGQDTDGGSSSRDCRTVFLDRLVDVGLGEDRAGADLERFDVDCTRLADSVYALLVSALRASGARQADSSAIALTYGAAMAAVTEIVEQRVRGRLERDHPALEAVLSSVATYSAAAE